MEAGDGNRPPSRIRHVGLLTSEAFRIAVVSIPLLPAPLADFCLFDSIFLDPSRLLHDDTDSETPDDEDPTTQAGRTSGGHEKFEQGMLERKFWPKRNDRSRGPEKSTGEQCVFLCE